MSNIIEPSSSTQAFQKWMVTSYFLTVLTLLKVAQNNALARYNLWQKQMREEV